MVTRRQIVAGLIVTGLGRLASHQPVSAVHLQDDQPIVLMGAAAALRGGLKAQPADHAANRFHVSRRASPEGSFTWELEVSKAGAFEVTALVRGTGYQDGGIGEASLEYMKALKAEVGV